MQTTDFFEGLKVVEFASVLAGPAVGMFFAELGAEVVKVENKQTGGDVTRNWKLATENRERDTSAYFASVNYGKKHLFLNLKEQNDYQQAAGLIKTADVVLVNFKQGAAEKLKLDFDAVKSINPTVIYASVTGFSSKTNRPAFDIVLQAETGFLSMTGHPDRPFAKLPVALIDLFAAHQLKEGILIALLQRQKLNKAQKVEVSLEDAAIASLANQASNWLMEGHIPQPIGSEHPNIAPYGDILYTRENTPVIIATGTDRQFEALCKVLHLDLHNDPDYQTNQARVKNRKHLKQLLNQATKTVAVDQLMNLFEENAIPAARILNVRQVFEKEPARNLVLKDSIGKRVKTAVFKISS